MSFTLQLTIYRGRNEQPEPPHCLGAWLWLLWYWEKTSCCHVKVKDQIWCSDGMWLVQSLWLPCDLLAFKALIESLERLHSKSMCPPVQSITNHYIDRQWPDVCKNWCIVRTHGITHNTTHHFVKCGVMWRIHLQSWWQRLASITARSQECGWNVQCEKETRTNSKQSHKAVWQTFTIHHEHQSFQTSSSIRLFLHPHITSQSICFCTHAHTQWQQQEYRYNWVSVCP